MGARRKGTLGLREAEDIPLSSGTERAPRVVVRSVSNRVVCKTLLYYKHMFTFAFLKRLEKRLPSKRIRLTVLVLIGFVLLGVLGSYLYHTRGEELYTQQEIEETIETWIRGE